MYFSLGGSSYKRRQTPFGISVMLYKKITSVSLKMGVTILKQNIGKGDVEGGRP